MQKQRFGCWMFAAALGAAPLYAAARGEQGEEEKAAMVMAATRDALGGGRAERLKTFSLEADLTRNAGRMQLASEIELLVQLPDRYLRTETSGGPMAGAFSTGFNGETAIRPAGGPTGGGVFIRIGPGPGPGGPGPLREPMKMTPEEQAQADRLMVQSARAELSRMMLGLFATAHPSTDAHYAYAGEAEAPDGRAHVVDVTGADGFAARLFIDRESRLPLMLTYRAPQPRMVMRAEGPAGRGTPARQGGGTRAPAGDTLMAAPAMAAPDIVDHTLYFAEWRDVDGVKVPHLIRKASAGETTEEWTVRRVRLDPAIDPGKFER